MSMKLPAYYPPVLGYHSVGAPPAPHAPSVTAASFEAQLRAIRRLRYRILTGAEFAAGAAAGRLPRRSVLITFDDGYADNYAIAWPLLRRYDAPAVIFATPNEVGTPGFATWEQLREMAAAGITIGCHTMRHSYIPDLDPALLRREITDAKAVLEENLARPVDLLSYPIGGFTRAAQDEARAAGYALAFTTNRAYPRSPRFEPFAVRRIKITDKDRGLILTVKLSGYYDGFRKLKNPE